MIIYIVLVGVMLLFSVKLSSLFIVVLLLKFIEYNNVFLIFGSWFVWNVFRIVLN